MKKITLLFCFFSLVIYSQENEQELVANFINSQTIFNNANQEKFFMHTNKSLYFSGEKIWYKIYVVNDVTGVPNYKTSNLHVNIYNDKKELIKSDLVFVEKGMVNGFIGLDASYNTGTYYIALGTVYGLNFNSTYIKEIEVVNVTEKQPGFNENKITVKNSVPEDEVSILQLEIVPESNILLGRAYNTVYVKAVLNGKPIQVSASIVEQESQMVKARLQTNNHGVGAVELPCYIGKSYVLKTIVNNTEYIKSLPLVSEKGFVIHYDYKSTTDKEVVFKIVTNTETNKEYVSGEGLYAVVHRNGVLKSVIPIVIDAEYNNYALKIEKEGLFNGVNTFTVFNNKNKQLVSRNFFFNKKKDISLSIEKAKETKDSIQLKINLLNKYIKANASISVLTDQTKMYNSRSNIKAEYLIKPYVELSKEDAKAILSHATSLKDKDILLQISKGFKEDVIIQQANNISIKPENGLVISGLVNTSLNNLNGCKVLLTSKENNIVLFKELKGEKTFAFTNLLLVHPSQYKLALLNSAGVIQDAKFTINPITTKYKADSILKYNVNQEKNIHFNVEDSIYVNRGEEQLEEIMLFAKKENKKITSLDSIGYVNNPKELGNGFTETTKKNPIQCKGCTIFEYLDQIPNIETRKTSEISPSTVVFTNRGINTFLGSNQAYVLIDGAPLNSDLSVLNDLYVEDVEYVRLNRSGAGYGIRGASGVVEIKLKKKKAKVVNAKDTRATTSQTAFGFKINNTPFQYKPLQFSSSRAKMYYDTVDWVPEFTIMPNKDNFITVAKEGNEGLKIIINGLNEEGDMLYKEVNVYSNTIN
ncbi:hypothetical protein KO494_11125 [Lacinutrix sp. C3R15]|uniref:hypothetical protein n=1 Tax=Flavobacteriaceae TaxID=49546 RepID=UPI001C08F45A|nr:MULTISPECIES: hypothetical protein [Flavobacteriaceae]MBU2940091.1 hypothetical protein [Lacinutrix sp. C3R15]MDO6623408.1 hypothetical protein [Oceanihabitans sp. 1_MG-2023]